MKPIRNLAFDFGASSGRAILSQWDGGHVTVREIHRFSNDPVSARGTLYWDVLRLLGEIKEGMRKALVLGGFDALGIDTWGSDFGLLDRQGRLLENPVHYRDTRTEGMVEQLYRQIPRQEVYRRTGSQSLRYNTLYQLYYLARYRRQMLDNAGTLLFMPDLFAYFLTGELHTEYTIASTSQMFDLRTGDWCCDILEKLDIPTKILPPVLEPGNIYGMLSQDICRELGCEPVPVVAVCTHDTASAVSVIPAREQEDLYMSCGTWSLIGTVCSAPHLSPDAMRRNITNEGGFGHTARFLKNRMGMWLFQQTRSQLVREGKAFSYADMEAMAREATPFVCFIDPDDPVFSAPGDMPGRIRQFCWDTRQTVPETDAQVIRCIYDSLAMDYRRTARELGAVLGRCFTALHIIGGGAKDALLCQLVADSCELPVTAGPSEATGLGNLAVQMVALGACQTMDQAREALGKTQTLAAYTPRDPRSFEKNEARFLRILGGNTL